MLAFEICKTYLKMILKVWEESVSNIFNTLFHKLNETFRGCIIANIWASQLHFIFQRYIFPDSPTFPTLVVLHYDISAWMDLSSKRYLFCSRYFLRSQQYFFSSSQLLFKIRVLHVTTNKKIHFLDCGVYFESFPCYKDECNSCIFGPKNIWSPFTGRSYVAQ